MHTYLCTNLIKKYIYSKQLPLHLSLRKIPEQPNKTWDLKIVQKRNYARPLQAGPIYTRPGLGLNWKTVWNLGRPWTESSAPPKKMAAAERKQMRNPPVCEVSGDADCDWKFEMESINRSESQDPFPTFHTLFTLYLHLIFELDDKLATACRQFIDEYWTSEDDCSTCVVSREAL